MNFQSDGNGNVSEMHLFAKDTRGSMRQYSIKADDFTIITRAGLLEGEKTSNEEHIPYGKASRSQHEQVISRMNSIINKKLDKGYVLNYEEARNEKRTNLLGLMQPMLAVTYKENKIKKIMEKGERVFAQPKYNGHRCIIGRVNGENIAYSRGGKLITSLDHIFRGIDLPDNIMFDGELYLHGMPLQEISSLIKRKQPETEKLSFVNYDVLIDEDYNSRMEFIQKYKFYNKFENRIIKAPTYPIENIEHIAILLDSFIDDGYEGSIIRLNDFGYQDGKRSQSLLKLKKYDDDNFRIIKVIMSDKWVPVAILETEDGKEFRATLPGDAREKARMYANKEDLINNKMNVKFFGYTNGGKPSQPVATGLVELL